MDIKIIVATHKQYKMPNDDMYVPLEVGAHFNSKTNYLKDNTGENISIKNKNYSELTGLYWAWKNLQAEYIGLVHYRRYFKGKKRIHSNDPFDKIVTSLELTDALKHSSIILPKKRNYYIETLYTHYKNTLYVEPLEETREIISEFYPEYLKEFDLLKVRRTGHMFNMFVMRKDKLNDYCEWLFDILLKLENKGLFNDYDNFHARFYGRISELLLDVWVRTNELSYDELDMIYMEPVNHVKKVTSFLAAKFFKKKYGKSF